MSEPPKPITQLAMPIDRSGRRGPNRLGRAAQQVALWPFPAVLLVSALIELVAGTTDPPRLVAPSRPVILALVGVLFPAALLTAVGLAVGALVSAANRYLRRREAVAAIVIAALLLGLWSLVMFRGWGTMLRA